MNLQPPLAGLRVLEIGHYIAAPFCSRLLADLGADVIKVEPPTGDPARTWGQQIDGRAPWWSMHARNKKCITANLKDPRAVALIARLADRCDVLVENFRPGQLARMGLSAEKLRVTNPALIMAHVSGYGQTGPGKDRAAFGVIGEAQGGLRYLTNHRPNTVDLPPVRVGVSIGDSIAGLYAAFGIVVALWQRDKNGGTGHGRSVDVALTEAVLSMMEAMLPEYGTSGTIKQPTGGGIVTAAPTNAYATADGEWVLIAANSDPLFRALATVMQQQGLADDPRFASNMSRVQHVAVLDHLIQDWTQRFPADALLELLSQADIPSSKVYTVQDIAEDPQYRAREMVRPVSDPHFPTMLHAGVVPRFDDDAGIIRWSGADIGQHNQEIYADVLGLSLDQISELKRDCVI